jgi:ubiquinone/menaquinone biosynthesis C-methylase UbiE
VTVPRDYDADPERLAPHPAVLADGARLPVADARVDAVAALYTLCRYDDPLRPVGEARRVLRRGGLFAACAPGPRQRAGTGRRAGRLGRPVHL